VRIDNNTDVPKYILDNANLYNFVLDRDMPNANLRDYSPPVEQVDDTIVPLTDSKVPDDAVAVGLPPA
jgi:hypothetical protein